jgi:putative oxidoreductase
MNMRTLAFFETTTYSLLIVLYTYTGISKLSEYERFKSSLRRSPLIDQGADIIAWLLPAIELVVVLLLFFEQSRKAGLIASLVLLVLFTLYLLYMVLFVADLPCGCGGVLTNMSWQEHVWFNLFFMGINVLGLFAIRKQEQALKHIQY